MQTASFILVIVLFFLLLFLWELTLDSTVAAPISFTNSLSEKVAKAERQQTNVVAGKEGWLFFTPELRHLSVEQFWGDAAKKVSQASNPEFADPLPAIIDFNTQLDGAGIELIFVPIPAKATIYPEMISEHGVTTARTDIQHQKFYDILRKQGVNVSGLTHFLLKSP